ncbi:glycosyltransferase family 2 protein [Microvirga massiliensis]|uniref:glycosyltransferase family 2 protein n=1 Tax=Microvirga massiliensis TaxID=1033741 RepID=UPI00062B4C98|nr:glycosyltransferase family 2 protein [Microvirga massiliensis]
MTSIADYLAPLSVVIPTYNRAELIGETLRICNQHAGGVPLEFIVIDDGSTDHTPQVLHKLEAEIPGLTWRSVENGGPGQARNLGCSLAKHDVILFLGDDIQPLNDDFFRVHSRIHAAFPSDRYAVLGKAVWPTKEPAYFNFVMAHIQGHRGEQFGYADMIPYSWLDCRFFYTINISVKKSVVSDWKLEGFRPELTLAAFEDVEFAYRLSKQVGGFKIFYDPGSIGQHIHPYTAEGFMARQHAAGMMAKVLFDIHPEMVEVLHLVDFMQSLRSQPNATNCASADYLSIIEGIKAWVRVLDRQHALGRAAWHNDLLTAVFHLSFLQGLLIASADATSNISGAYEYILDKFSQHINCVIDHELTAHEFMKAGFLRAGH